MHRPTGQLGWTLGTGHAEKICVSIGFANKYVINATTELIELTKF